MSDAALGVDDEAAPDAATETTDAVAAKVGVDAADEEASVSVGPSRRCPKDMVNVDGRFCVDRYENTMVDDSTSSAISPHYPPEPSVAQRIFAKWEKDRLTVGPSFAREMELPILPSIELTETFAPRAVSRKGVLPQAYISGRVAGEACSRAKKRLCTHEEWQYACRGEKQTKYPYGNEYTPGICNVFRSSHPAAKLHDNASLGHSDPRLGLVKAEDGPLLRVTGATKECGSWWGKDAAYDMVGNVDEWIDDPDGTFVGGFFSRSTKEGCDSIVTVHPLIHWDYSIGVRCCR